MASLIYDGGCPFCASYVGFLNLREHYPDLELVDARANPDHPAVRRVRDSSLVIDEGMALVENDGIIHGADVIQRLSEGRAHGIFFKTTSAANKSYRALRAGRNLALRILRRDRLGF